MQQGQQPGQHPGDAAYYLARVVQKIAQTHDLSGLMEIVRRAARELTGADGATLVLREGDKCHYADEDAIGPLWKGQRFPMSTCISGWTMMHGEAVVIEDIYADVRIPHEAYRPTFVKSLCMVPIGRDKPIGAIGCYWSRHYRATAAEVDFQQALADAAAVGITNIELYRQLDEARQEAELRAAEAQKNAELFQTTFEHAGTGIAHVGLDGRWLRVNRKLCEILGYTRHELLQMTFQDVTYADDLETDLYQVAQVLEGKIQTYSLEKRYFHRDGRLVWVKLTVTLERDAQGEPEYFISIIEDIDRRKAAEDALEEERETFRTLANISAEYFWELDEQFRFKEISRSIGQRSGISYTRFIGMTRWEIPYAGVSEASWDKHRATLMAHEPFRNFEASLMNSIGEMRWFYISGDPVFSRTGEFKGYRGVTQDITERRLAEQRLRQHAMVFESSQEGIVITDVQGCVIDANGAFERITEYRLDDIRGENMRFLQSGKQDRSFYLDMWQSIEECGSWQGEIWNRRKGGEIYLEWVSIYAVKDERGDTLAYVGTHIDINRMNHAKSEMERLAHHDALTGLPNRLLLKSRLGHALDRAKRGGGGAVLFFDLDGFKQINDTFGHRAGDELLIAASARLRQRIRDIDTLARLGGDEFVIVLEDVPARDDVALVAREVIGQLSKPFELPDGKMAHIGCSIGIALFPEHGTTSRQLMERADHAMYAAKHAGKGGYRFFAERGDGGVGSLRGAHANG